MQMRFPCCSDVMSRRSITNRSLLARLQHGFRDRSTKISKTTPCKVADGCRHEDFRILRNSLTRRANQRHDAIIQGEAHGTGRAPKMAEQRAAIAWRELIGSRV